MRHYIFSVVLAAAAITASPVKADWWREDVVSAFSQKKSFTIYNRSGENTLLVDCESEGGLKVAFLSPPDSSKNWLEMADAGSFLLLRFDDEPMLELGADYLPTAKGVVVIAHDPAKVVDRLRHVFSRLAVALKSGDDIWLETHFPYANTPRVVGGFLKDCDTIDR